MGLGLPFGGHLTHGWGVNFSGIQYHAVQYDVDRQTHRVDLNRIEEMAKQARPKLLLCGGTAYPRSWDFEGFSQIAESVGATLVADIAHIAGLVVAGAHPHPFPHAHIATTTTHKTLRGPRGGMILSDGTFSKELDRAVFPGLQGGPRLISGGTDNHMILMDVTPRGVNGKPAAKALQKAGIECNYNTVPFDPRKPFDPSGLRIGTPSITSRGMKEAQMPQIANWIDRVLDKPNDDAALSKIRAEVAEFCRDFPAPGIRV
jgi:glycine hydroxymethyltransferase